MPIDPTFFSATLVGMLARKKTLVRGEVPSW
jgi:hypothetical protein